MGELTSEQHLRILYFMRLTRALEERLAVLVAHGKALGSLFRSLGQEATSVGAAAALDAARGDVVAPLLRDLGALLVMGGTPTEVFRQYLATGESPSQGRDLNIHFGSPERHFVGPVSVLGDMIPVAAGIALGMRMRGTDAVALTFIGDGGFATGPVHEGLNFAAVQQVPLVVVIENNGFAFSTSTARHVRVKSLAVRAKAYGVPGVSVDGNDALAVVDATAEAVARARAGGGPTLVECMTYRRAGHAQHDDESYVDAAERAAWAEKDPIARYERVLVARGIASEPTLSELDARIAAELDEAERAALESSVPEAASAAAGVFHDSIATRAPWLAPLT